jgi:hypothetical protein
MSVMIRARMTACRSGGNADAAAADDPDGLQELDPVGVDAGGGRAWPPALRGGESLTESIALNPSPAVCPSIEACSVASDHYDDVLTTTIVRAGECMVPPRPRRPHGAGEGEDGPPSEPRSRPHGGGGGGESVAAQHDAVAARLQEGRVGERASGSGGPGEQAGDSDVALESTGPEAIGPHDFVDNLVGNPQSIAGRSAEDIAGQFTAAGYPAHVEQSTKKGTSQRAQQVRIEGHPEIANIQVHPGGGRHTPEGSPYWKISTSTQGKTWVVPADFRGADELGGNVVRYDQ